MQRKVHVRLAFARWATAAALLATLLLVGCGFHLQGAVPLAADLRQLALRAPDSQSDFVRAMRRALLDAGAQLQTSSNAQLIIERDELLERVASVSARNVPREYELTYIVRFSLRFGNETRIDAEEITVTRDFSFDERIMLAKEREREQLRATLAQEAAGIVLQRLASQR
ncbi:MAG: hypothetical protein FJ179_00230 [Gammaproteobacteria bacterium]|nr:hypothetical protein [Gammaproteobacteria bacterium]